MDEISVEIPDEPPPRSVVLDRNGDAWQSRRNLMREPSWSRTAGDDWQGQSVSWPVLLVLCGPLRVLHYAEAPTKE
jgi:hypothetical protein